MSDRAIWDHLVEPASSIFLQQATADLRLLTGDDTLEVVINTGPLEHLPGGGVSVTLTPRVRRVEPDPNDRNRLCRNPVPHDNHEWWSHGPGCGLLLQCPGRTDWETTG